MADDKIIDFKQAKEARTPNPNMAGKARCAECSHEWLAVAPPGTRFLECPQCRTMKGIWVHGTAPAAGLGYQLWTCVPCGCDVFMWVRDQNGNAGLMCWRCGEVQKGY